jgi:hypothetical protein
MGHANVTFWLGDRRKNGSGPAARSAPRAAATTRPAPISLGQFVGARRCLTGLGALYVGIVLSAGGSGWAKPAFYASAVAWTAAFFLAARRRSCLSATPGAWLRAGEVAVTNVVLALVLAECGLQALVAFGAGGELARADLAGFRLKPKTDYGAGLVSTALGYPGPELPRSKPAGLIRIVALGDSFAIGPAVPFADNYLTRLGQELSSTELANLGLSGAGPREYQEILEYDGWPLQPDLVLVSIFVGNDISEILARPRNWDPRRHAVYQLGERTWRLAREAWRGNTPITALQTDRLAAPPLSAEAYREVEARRLAVCQMPATASMEKKWRQALAALGNIADACKRRRVALAVVLIPDEFQVNAAVLDQAIRDAGVAMADLDLSGPQRRLAAFFSERGVPCLDLLPTFHDHAATYAPRDTHWNVAGNHLAARCLAQWLRSQPPWSP